MIRGSRSRLNAVIAAFHERTDEVEVRRGLEVAHDAGALAHEAHLLQRRRLDLADEAGGAEQLCGASSNVTPAAV